MIPNQFTHENLRTGIKKLLNEIINNREEMQTIDEFAQAISQRLASHKPPMHVTITFDPTVDPTVQKSKDRMGMQK